MSNIDKSTQFLARYQGFVHQTNGTDVLTVGSTPVQLTRTRVGTTNPKWKEQILNLENATTGLNATYDQLVNHEPVQGNWKYLYVPNGSVRDFKISGDLPLYNGIWNPGMIVPSLAIDKASNGARAKFYSMLRSEAQALSGPTFLGELRETLRMIKRPMAALHSSAHGYLDALSKAKRRNPKAWTQAISGAWLEHSFGWSPLINDVKDAMTAYSRLGKPRPGRLFSVGFKDTDVSNGGLQSPFNATTSANVPGVYLRLWYKGKIVNSVVVRYKGRLKAQSEQAPFDNWKLFGFQSNEFLPTAWELLPWSFLIDYFTNVGDILRAAATITDNVEVAWINLTIVQSAQADLVCFEDVEATNSISNNSWSRVSGGMVGGTSSTLRKVVSRAPGVGIPDLPTFALNFKLGDGQLFNIAALLGQAKALHPQATPRNWHR